jgi:hypothetical protein
VLSKTRITRNARIAPMLLAAGVSMSTLITTQAWASASIVAQDGLGYMVVNRNDAALRSGDQDVFYAIARLASGTVLRTVGESGAYTSVVISDSLGAFVPATEVERVAGAERVRLSVESKLRAPSHLMGLSGSWKQLYTTALPAGTELDILEALTNESGGVVGYRVRAPKSPAGEYPLGFILTDDLRPALSSEIEDGTQDPIPPSDGSDDAAENTPDPEPLPDTQPEQDESETNTAVDTSLLEEQVTNEPVEIENATPVATEDEPAIIIATEARIPTSELESLEAAFNNARSMPREELDVALDELLAEFSRTRAEADDDESLARALDQRIEWIQIRTQTRDQRRRIAEALAQYDANADETAQAIQAWQQGRAYQLVGRMVTSSVYTGENLPLLYRVQGTDPITGQPRTIGYVAPKQGQDLRHMIGRVVGVLGVMRDDEALELRVVEPERVDLMPE